MLIYFYFYVYMCFACMHVYALGVYLVPEEVREGVRPLRTGLWMVVSSYVGAGN